MGMRLIVAVAGLVLAAAAHADDLSLVASPAARCLGVAPGAATLPAYPAEMERWKVDAKVRATLTFTAPDLPPALEIDLRQDVADDFRRAVRNHAANLRLPCMEARNGPVVLRQDFEFRHDDRKVAWTVPEDLADPARIQMLKCVAPMAGRSAKPQYPGRALRDGRMGRVMLKLRFVAGDSPPQVEQFVYGWNRDLSAAAAKWAEDLRMPCHQGSPVDAMWTFEFRFTDDDRLSTLKDMPLTTFLGAVKDLKLLKARHDFNAMGCPFDVRLTYLRPHLPNQVGEVGEARPGRADFLAWLSTLTLDLPATAEGQVLGSQATITVPCGRLQFE